MVVADSGGGEVVMLRMDDGVCFGLNQVGAAIWQRLESDQTVEQLTQSLLSEFNVDPETCERQLVGLLQELIEERLVTVRPA